MRTVTFKNLLVEGCPVNSSVLIIGVHTCQTEVNDSCFDAVRWAIHGRLGLRREACFGESVYGYVFH
jgi:hypothetical protein